MHCPCRFILLICMLGMVVIQGPTGTMRKIFTPRQVRGDIRGAIPLSPRSLVPESFSTSTWNESLYVSALACFHQLQREIDPWKTACAAKLEGGLAVCVAWVEACGHRWSRHEEKGETDGIWLDNYAKAMTAAERQRKMLFVYFCSDCGDEPCSRFKTETLDNPQVRQKLHDYVCVRVPIDAKIIIDGQQVTLLDHPAFHEMLGRPGIAIVDFRNSDPKLQGAVVSMFPITDKLWYTPERMAVILDLPPGTLTQRTLIYAVRIHPEKPASTSSQLNPDLLREAESHASYQAEIQVQGHQQWGSRFQRIVARLPGGMTAREVCAESWPGENLVEAAIECVRCWRLSDGHWSAVRAPNRCFGYDMKRGGNGVWYATGIFGTR